MVEWAGLENRNTRKRIVGSNPTLSANVSARILRRSFLFPACALLLSWGLAPAAAAQKLPVSAVEAFIEDMVQKHHFDRGSLRRLFGRVQSRPAVIQAISAPGTAQPWHVFRSRYVEPVRINAGIRFWSAHAVTLPSAF